MPNFFHNFINLSKNASYINCSKILPYAGLLDENVRLYLQLARKAHPTTAIKTVYRRLLVVEASYFSNVDK